MGGNLYGIQGINRNVKKDGKKLKLNGMVKCDNVTNPAPIPGFLQYCNFCKCRILCANDKDRMVTIKFNTKKNKWSGIPKKFKCYDKQEKVKKNKGPKKYKNKNQYA
jgi:hypothetical protein